ncbi:MAG: YfhO family protein, partial [Chloroflexota bacterium]
LNYVVLLQFAIAGIGTYLFARSLGLWQMAACVAAIAFMFSGFLATRVVHLSILSGAALLPLVFFCVERALRAGNARWFVIAALVVALQAFAGHPQVPIYTALALGLYTLVRALERMISFRQWHWILVFPLQLAGIYMLGYLFAAIQLVPWVELGSFSPRASEASFDFIFRSSMQGDNWLLFLFPYLYGSLNVGMYADQPMDIPTAIKTWEHSAYVGILPLALAVIGLFGLAQLPRRKERVQHNQRTTVRLLPETTVAADYRRWFSILFFGLLLAVGVIMATGDQTPFAELIYATPALGRLRAVERAIILAAFALTMLAAFGMQRIVEPGPSGRRIVLQLELLLVAIIVPLVPLGIVYFADHPTLQNILDLQPGDIANLQISRLNILIPIQIALVTALLLCWWIIRIPSGFSKSLALALLLVDVGSYAALFNPIKEPQLYDESPGVVTFLEEDDSLYRKATFLETDQIETELARGVLAVSWGMVYGVEDINGFNSLQPRRYTDYLFSPQVEDVSYGKLSNEALLQPDNPVLPSLNVKYLLVPQELQPNLGSTFEQVYEDELVRVYENTTVYERAYFVDRVEVVSDQQAVLETVTAAGFDGQQTALVETVSPLAISEATGEATVSITDHTPNQTNLSVSTTEERLLVMSEMYFPGWHAYINGEETPIYRTNYLFRGIVVPEGEHTITFEYRPNSLIIGGTLSMVAIIIMIGLLLIRQRKALPKKVT